MVLGAGLGDAEASGSTASAMAKESWSTTPGKYF